MITPEPVKLNLSLKHSDSDIPSQRTCAGVRTTCPSFNNQTTTPAIIGPTMPAKPSIRQNPYLTPVLSSTPLAKSADSDSARKSPKSPTQVNKTFPCVRETVNNSTKRSKKPARDVTQSRRYKNSLSFLLGSMFDNEETKKEERERSSESESCDNVTNGAEKNIDKVVDKPESNDNGDEESDKKFLERSAKSLVLTYENTQVCEDKVTDNKSTMEVDPPPIQEKQNLAINPITPSLNPNPTKPPLKPRPSPYTFSKPTLAKTTAKLFSSTPNNYLKGCTWSPDGLALLTCSKDKIVRIFNIPDITSSSEQHPVAVHQMANVPYDVQWNPDINHLRAEKCNFVASCKDSPIQMVDAFTGKTLASFTAFDKVEVLISAFSVCYLDPTTIIGGYCKHVRVFDATRPGRECSMVTVGDMLHQNNNSIVSTIARHPTTRGLFAAGCYNTTVGLYSTHMNGVLMPFYGPRHGITQIMFSQDGNRLYCGSRMEGEIYCFDTRYNGSILQTYTRQVNTNQRIQFDINKSETLLATGNHDGTVTLFDLASDPGGVSRDLSFEAHTDTVNGVSFHPFWGLLATASGRRHFHIEDAEIEENSLKIWTFEKEDRKQRTEL